MQKRQINDDVFTTPMEAAMRAYELGMGTATHVHEVDGQAFHMPGSTHEDYLTNSGAEVITEDGDAVSMRTLSAVVEAVARGLSGKAARGMKVNEDRRIVYGWASVWTEGGKVYVDKHDDIIKPDDGMKMADDFMLDYRTGKLMHQGEKIGEVVHSLPLTKELGAALGVMSDREGWIIAMKVHSDEIWERAKAGEFAAFSIGGRWARNAV